MYSMSSRSRSQLPTPRSSTNSCGTIPSAAIANSAYTDLQTSSLDWKRWLLDEPTRRQEAERRDVPLRTREVTSSRKAVRAAFKWVNSSRIHNHYCVLARPDIPLAGDNRWDRYLTCHDADSRPAGEHPTRQRRAEAIEPDEEIAAGRQDDLAAAAAHCSDRLPGNGLG